MANNFSLILPTWGGVVGYIPTLDANAGLEESFQLMRVKLSRLKIDKFVQLPGCAIHSVWKHADVRISFADFALTKTDNKLSSTWKKKDMAS